MRGLNILKQSEPLVNKPNSKLQALKTNLESNIPTEYNNLFNQKEVRKSNLDLTNQDYLSGYENYENYAGGLDLNEIRAQNQFIFDKAAAGVVRIGTKAVSEIAKMPGVIGGILTAPFAEEGEGWETAFNNQWIKSISQFNEDVNAELLPVYVKKAVSEGNLWDNISSIDFWATEGADGIGFIASMFAPGAALKSLNFGHKVLGTTAKSLSMINGEAKLAGAVRTLEGLGINANKIDMAGITMANTLFESGSEAGSAMDSFQKDIDKKLASGEINQQQYEQLQTQKGKLGRDIFVSNLAILLVPNAIQTKMIWGKGVGSQLVKDTPSLMAKIGNRGKNVLGALGSEGFLEEGSQSTVETMFSNKAKRGELTDDMSQDFNVSELVSSYIDTLNTTEGQKAIFLGGVLGGGMSAYQGGKSDIATRKQTQDVLTLAEEKVGIFNKINETDVYKRDENGDIVYNYNNQPQYDSVKVKEVAKALNYTEEQSQLFDQAIQEGNTQVIQTLKNNAINQLVTPFINRGELGIQALSQYLDTTLKTEEIGENEDAKALKSKIIEQATYMQDQLNSYKDFSKSLINIENPDATKQDIADYYNRLGDVYINLKGSEYFQKGELKKLNTQKTKLLKDLGDTEISTELNPDYIEGKTEEIYKFNNKPVDARVKLLNEQIEQVNNNLSEIDKIINDEIWNNEKVNESFNKKVKENNKLREESSPEQVAKNDEVITAVKSSTTEDEVTDIEKNAPPEVITNPVIKNQIDNKKAEIIQAEKVANETQIAEATQEDNDFNDTTTYSDLNGTEGSSVTDELTPKDSENNTAEEVKKVENEEEIVGKGAQVISTHRKDSKNGKNKLGDALDFIKEKFSNFLKYEKEPVDKTGRPVTFEINTNPGPKVEINEALNLYNILTERGFNTMTDAEFNLLYDYLPINARFTPDVNAPILNKYKIKDEKTGEWVDKMDTSTGNLRTHIINNLRNGIAIENMSTTIQSQYKGMLKVDDNRLTNNNILELDGVPNLKYVRDNLYVVDSFGNLKNIQTGKIVKFANDKVKSNAAGEIYLMIPQANGLEFPLKLNIKKLDGNKAYTLASIYSHILKVKGSSNMTLSEVQDGELLKLIDDNFSEELKVIVSKDRSVKDVKLGEIIDLLVYESDNIKSRINITNDVLYYGDKEATSENIDDVIMEVAYFLNQNKRHQIKIGPKFATDNTKTNLQSNSADYLKYLIDNNILSTNAVVNEPTFQGYTNIYLNTAVTVNNELIVSDAGVEVKTEGTGFDSLFQEDIVQSFEEVKNEVIQEFNDNDEIVNYIYLDGLHYISTINDNYYVIPDINGNRPDAYPLKVTKKQIIKPYRTEAEWKKAGIIFKNNQPKISDAGIQVTATNTGFDNLFENKPENVRNSQEQLILSTVKDDFNNTPLLKNDTADFPSDIIRYIPRILQEKAYENDKGNNPKIGGAGQTIQRIIERGGYSINEMDKLYPNWRKELISLNNIRNSQENFVSLSEIKGTVENKQLKETQAEVFNENKTPPSATEMRLINKAIAVYQEDASKLTDVQKKRLEEYATNYPESWKKICK